MRTLQEEIQHTRWHRLNSKSVEQLIKGWLQYTSVEHILNLLHSEHPQDLNRVYKTLDHMGLLYHSVYDGECE